MPPLAETPLGAEVIVKASKGKAAFPVKPEFLQPELI
jgi:hypothetical protein